ncbi:MAG TPA: BON domain-containing protein [Pyrinomonadaceae bacterium]|nr:BON domain-containing protein [Pyrinomonadaceae bacterium]
MRQRLAGLIAISGLAFALAGCGTTEYTNANMNANMNANLNANMAVNTNVNADTTRRAPSREEYERDRDRYDREAKEAGRTIGSGVNDGWLWVKTRFELAAADDLRDSTVEVDVEDATVTLTGTVATAQQRSRAEEIAKSIEGVKAVRNNLKVAADS